MRSLLLATGLVLTFAVWGISAADAAVASITYQRVKWGQWVVTDSKAHLDQMLNYLRSVNGSFSIELRCNGTGWIAQSHSNYPPKEGLACGFPTAAAAKAAARRKCQSVGGTNCQPVLLRYDTGTYEMDRNDSNPIYHLHSRAN